MRHLYCFSIFQHFAAGICGSQRLVFQESKGGPEASKESPEKPVEDLDKRLSDSRSRLESAQKELHERIHGYRVDGTLVTPGLTDTVIGHLKVPALDDAEKVLGETEKVLKAAPTDADKQQKIDENEAKTKEIARVNEALDALEYRETVRKLQSAVSTAGVFENSGLREMYQSMLDSYPAITPRPFTDLNSSEKDQHIGLLRENLRNGPQDKDDRTLRRLVRDNPPDVLLEKAQQEIDEVTRAEVAVLKEQYPTYLIEVTFSKKAEKVRLEKRIGAIFTRDESDPFIKTLNGIKQFYVEAMQRRTVRELVRSPESDENAKSYITKEAEASKARMATKSKELRKELILNPSDPDNPQKQQKISQLEDAPPAVDTFRDEALTSLSMQKGQAPKEKILNDFRANLNAVENTAVNVA